MASTWLRGSWWPSSSCSCSSCSSPRACESLFGAGDEQGSETPETADVESSGDEGEEESVTEEDTAPLQEELAKREDAADSDPDDEGATSEAVGEDESSGGVANIELETGPVGPLTGFGGIAGGGEVVGIPQEVPSLARVSRSRSRPSPPKNRSWWVSCSSHYGPPAA